MKLPLAIYEKIRIEKDRLLPDGDIDDHATRPRGETRSLECTLQTRAVVGSNRALAVVACGLHSGNKVFLEGVDHMRRTEVLRLRLTLVGHLGHHNVSRAFGFAALDDAEANWTGTENENIGARLDVALSHCAPACGKRLSKGCRYRLAKPFDLNSMQSSCRITRRTHRQHPSLCHQEERGRIRC